MILRILIVFGSLLTSACASWLTCPLPAAFPAMGAAETLPTAAVQVIKIQYGEHQADLLCAFARESARWRLACTSATGIRLITLNVDESGEVETSRSALVPAAVDGARIASDFVLAFWPEAAVRRWADQHGYSLLASRTSRSLRRGGRRLISVSYADSRTWAGPVSIEQHELGYHLKIETQNIRHDPNR